MKRYLLLTAFMLISIGAFAQTSKPVLGTPVSRQEGKDIIVEYSIQMEPGVACEVAVYLSCDGGRRFAKTPLKQVSGDVGTIEEAGTKAIIWHVVDEEEALTGDDLAFKVNVERYWSNSVPDANKVPATRQNSAQSPEKKVKPMRQPKNQAIFVSPTVGLLPNMSYGIMAGWTGSKIGAYGKFRSNFVNTGSTYDCTSDGRAGTGYIWTNGNSNVSLMSITAGIVMPLEGAFYPYAGIGFSKRELAWQDSSGKWARVTDASISGIGLEAGIMFRFGMFGLHGGVNTAGFKKLGVDAGIALFF